MAVQLNTLAPKKWSASYSGVTPTLDTTDGISVGDIAIDTSTTVPLIWECYDNTDDAPVWKLQEQPGIVTKTTTYAASVSDSTIKGNTAAAGFTITLPTAVGIAGKKFTIVKTSSDSNILTVAFTGAQTASGNTTLEITGQWVSVDLKSDGANYIIN